jgi:hypothetical protein
MLELLELITNNLEFLNLVEKQLLIVSLDLHLVQVLVLEQEQLLEHSQVLEPFHLLARNVLHQIFYL